MQENLQMSIFAITANLCQLQFEGSNQKEISYKLDFFNNQ